MKLKTKTGAMSRSAFAPKTKQLTLTEENNVSTKSKAKRGSPLLR